MPDRIKTFFTPGSTLGSAVELALFLKQNRLRPEQVQDFYPTPGTVSTCMFYTGIDPLTQKPVFVAKTPNEKAMQRALLQYFKPEMRHQVIQALVAAGREDLIGNGQGCLVPPQPGATANRQKGEGAARNQKTGGRTGAKKAPSGKGQNYGKKGPAKGKKGGIQ